MSAYRNLVDPETCMRVLVRDTDVRVRQRKRVGIILQGGYADYPISPRRSTAPREMTRSADWKAMTRLTEVTVTTRWTAAMAAISCVAVRATTA